MQFSASIATMATDLREANDVPLELKDRLVAFDSAITDLEEKLKPLLTVPPNELNDKLKPLDSAKVDLLSGYAVNSLFWMYLNICGQNPKEHHVKQELDRIRSYMGRVKEIADKAKAPQLDKGAAKRFVRSALWTAAGRQDQDSTLDQGAEASSSTESMGSNRWSYEEDTSRAGKGKKRKRE